ncbi:MAG TPA: TetR/AcrR family transcriptional regulator, partial [Phycisphaerales bacterium]|nr:TetR/AcrR family transcriptional regulator [Phycisphaerales bacterium]
MSPQEQAHTRERLVIAARDLFHQQGYNATGIAQILKQAGANAGSLYYFFPTKEDLLRAVLEWYRDHIHEALLDPIWTHVSDPIERVFALLNGYRLWLIETEFVYGCPIGNLALELSATHPAVRDLIAKNFSNWKDAVRECFEDAKGKMPDGVDVAALASF